MQDRGADCTIDVLVGGSVLASASQTIDTQVSLAAYEGLDAGTVSLVLRATDTYAQKVFRRKFVHPIPSVLQGAA